MRRHLFGTGLFTLLAAACVKAPTAKPVPVLDIHVANVGVPDKLDKQGVPKSEGAAIAAIAAGDFRTCALTAAGGVKCWGYNSSGQLGDGTKDTRLEPTDVQGLASGVAAIAGTLHTCALTTAGSVKCWGSNRLGELGDGTTEGLADGFAAIAAGFLHTCALTSAGGVKCWGDNRAGQLGDGTTDTRHEPTDVQGLTRGVAAIAAGFMHTCALTSAGGVKCWGSNGHGALGDGTTDARHEPTDVQGLGRGIAAIATGFDHTCALTSAGGVKCWGRNEDGQLGDGTTDERHEPTDVQGLARGIAAISAGGNHTCALTSAGGVKCWGWNYEGELGDGTTDERHEPTDVQGLARGVTAISAAGGYHTCALTSAGGVKCWGSNGHGALGDGTTDERHEPTDVKGLASGVGRH